MPITNRCYICTASLWIKFTGIVLISRKHLILRRRNIKLWWIKEVFITLLNVGTEIIWDFIIVYRLLEYLWGPRISYKMSYDNSSICVMLRGSNFCLCSVSRYFGEVLIILSNTFWCRIMYSTKYNISLKHFSEKYKASRWKYNN